MRHLVSFASAPACRRPLRTRPLRTHLTSLVWPIPLFLTLLLPLSAGAAVIRVPQDRATIQAAVDAASDGDTVLIDAGNYAGARLYRKRLSILGKSGANATIVGAGSPTGWGGLAIGLLLDTGSDGATVENLTFDGEGISDLNPAPLAFAVYGRGQRDVTIQNNTIHGTIQAITGTAANHWTIQNNTITDFTSFTCAVYCGGGDAIVLQVDRSPGVDPSLPANRPRNSLVRGNSIWGTIPDGLTAFGMTGILLLSADSTEVSQNYVAIPNNPLVPATSGEAVTLTDRCCGIDSPWLPGTSFATVMNNQGSDSDWGLVVEGTGGENTSGLALMGNTGRSNIEGIISAAVPGPDSLLPPDDSGFIGGSNSDDPPVVSGLPNLPIP